MLLPLDLVGGEEITPAMTILEKSDQKWSCRRTQKTLSDMARIKRQEAATGREKRLVLRSRYSDRHKTEAKDGRKNCSQGKETRFYETLQNVCRCCGRPDHEHFCR